MTPTLPASGRVAARSSLPTTLLRASAAACTFDMSRVLKSPRRGGDKGYLAHNIEFSSVTCFMGHTTLECPVRITSVSENFASKS